MATQQTGKTDKNGLICTRKVNKIHQRLVRVWQTIAVDRKRTRTGSVK